LLQIVGEGQDGVRDATRALRGALIAFLNSPLGQLAVVLSYLLFLSASVALVAQVREGLDRSRLGRAGSSVVRYFHLEADQYRANPYRLQFVVTQGLDYWNETAREQVRDFLSDVRHSGLVDVTSDMDEDWLAEMEKFVGDMPTSK